jgi:hypothetical protein
MGNQSLETHAYCDALGADLSALGVFEGQPAAVEFRAMAWWHRGSRDNEPSAQALISEVEAALTLAPDAAAA